MKKVFFLVMGSALAAITSLSLLPIRAIAEEEHDPRRPLPTEPHEKYDMPPAPSPLWGIGVSPGMISVHDQFTSRQVNVNNVGMNITGDAANEPSISVDPNDPNRMTVGWRQFNSVTSNFRQAGFGWTNDGGATWTFPGVLQNNVFRSDPVLFADDTGRFYYNSLLQSFFDDVWRSLDGGQTYTNLNSPGNATGGDKQWYMIDNTTSTGHGFHYQSWSTAGNNFQGRQFSRSIDGGVTWMNPINIPHQPQWGTLDVDSTGNLFIGGVQTAIDQVWCIRSSNAKNGAVTPTFDQSTSVNMGGLFGFNQIINPEGLMGQLFLAVDRSGTATNNNIYMLASLRPTGATSGADVMFVRSTDGGATFSAPKRLNDDPINHSKWHWMGTFSVAPNGRLDSVWLDTRNAANNTDSQLFYSYSLDGGVNWSPNVAVSNSFNPFLGYPQQ
ncbi:MAG TPA: sialidase family protein, partial [Chthoniobacterales bacterium]|nr:sialidase family protein [Chthoniobacterales bacterium]